MDTSVGDNVIIEAIESTEGDQGTMLSQHKNMIPRKTGAVVNNGYRRPRLSRGMSASLPAFVVPLSALRVEWPYRVASRWAPRVFILACEKHHLEESRLEILLFLATDIAKTTNY